MKQSILCAAAVLALTGAVCAAPIVTEPFNYTAPSNLNGQGGWANISGTLDQVDVGSGNLTFAGLPASTGNRVNLTDAESEDVSRDFTPVTDGGSGFTVYTSALVNFTALPASGGAYFLHLTEPASTSAFFCRLFARDSSGSIEFGIRGSSSDGPAYGGGTHALNTTVFIVTKYESITGAGNDVVSIWVNPTPGASEPAAAATSTPSAEPSAAGLGRLSLRQAAGIGTLVIDEIRVGTTWADVTPDNSSVPDWSLY